MSLRKNIDVIALLLLVVVVSGCGNFSLYSTDKSPVVARVGEVELRETALNGIYSEVMTTEDSIKARTSFINSWALEEVKCQEALETLAENPKILAEIEKMVQTYRANLLIHTLEKNYLLRELDTLVSRAEIEAYYKENPNSFMLAEPLVKAIVVRMPKGLRQNEKLEKMFTQGDASDMEEFLNICKKNDYRVDDYRGDWVEFSTLLRNFPLTRRQNYDDFLKKNRNYDVTDKEYKYLLKVENYLSSQQISPLEREVHTIKNILRNRRRAATLKSLDDSLLRTTIIEIL